MKHITPELEAWLQKILLSEKSSFYVLHDLAKQDISNEVLKVELHPERVYRSAPLKEHQGYLSFTVTDNPDIGKEFLYFGAEAIEKNKFTIKGLVNYFILIDRLGSLHDQQHYDITRALIQKLEKNDYVKLINSVVDLFNQQYHFSHFDQKANLKCSEWDDLFFSIQYIERFNNPIDVLRRTINFRHTDLDLLEVLHILNPDPRAALLEYGLSLDNLTEENILNFLVKHPEEITFISAFIIDETSKKPNFVGNKLVYEMISEQWAIAGKYFFQKAVNRSRIPVNEDTKTLVTQELNRFLKECLASDKGEDILQTFSWPEDFMAMGGWLMYLKNNEPDYRFHDNFYNDLTDSFSKALSGIISNIKYCFGDSQRSYKLWFSEITDPRAQYAIGYIQAGILVCSKENFEQFQKQFKSFCYLVKQLYYGSYTANLFAKRLSGYILSLLLAYPIVEGDQKEEAERREEVLLEIFIEVLAYQWVLFTEREEVVWDNKTEGARYGDADLVYILEKLKNPRKWYESHISTFKEEINKLSTTKWPI